ncbi:MAG: hypothetical protein K1Y02_11165 [Candidatus Hydrogenedentes bacterium]|nr:hypothetical protein [Candidatus Hydrogenedentota bacterium]
MNGKPTLLERMRWGGITSLTLAAAATVVFIAVGCPPGTDSPPSIVFRNVDLAVGDIGLELFKKGLDTPAPPQILVYNNVLTEGSLQDPDLVFSGVDLPFIEYPISLQLTGDFTGNDLYSADYGSSTVAIWRDYRVLASAAKGSSSIPPDVLLDSETSGICRPIEILNVDNRLYVSNSSGECGFQNEDKQFIGGYVEVFDNAGAIVPGGGDTPTIEFDVPGAAGIEVEKNTLYVASSGFLFKGGNPFTGAVFVFEDIPQRIADLQTIIKGGNPFEPSVVLYGDSFLNIDDVRPWRVDVFENRLYVTTVAGIMFVFDNADSLVEGQVPSAVISRTTGNIGEQGDMKLLGDTLYVGATYEYIGQKKSVEDGLGMTAFRPGKEIVTGQNAAMSFDDTNSQIGRATCLSNEKDVLFVASGGPSCCSDYGDVHIFYDADTLTVPRPADFVLPSLKDFVNPVSIDTNDFFFPEPTE